MREKTSRFILVFLTAIWVLTAMYCAVFTLNLLAICGLPYMLSKQTLILTAPLLMTFTVVASWRLYKKQKFKASICVSLLTIMPILAIFLSGLISEFQLRYSPPTENYYRKLAIHSLERKHYDDAIIKCTNWIRKFPDMESYASRASAYGASGNFKQAESDYQKALDYKPSSIDNRSVVLCNLAKLNYRRGNYKRCVQLCDEALPATFSLKAFSIVHNPQYDHVALLLRSEAYERLGIKLLAECDAKYYLLVMKQKKVPGNVNDDFANFLSHPQFESLGDFENY